MTRDGYLPTNDTGRNHGHATQHRDSDTALPRMRCTGRLGARRVRAAATALPAPPARTSSRDKRPGPRRGPHPTAKRRASQAPDRLCRVQNRVRMGRPARWAASGAMQAVPKRTKTRDAPRIPAGDPDHRARHQRAGAKAKGTPGGADRQMCRVRHDSHRHRQWKPRDPVPGMPQQAQPRICAQSAPGSEAQGTAAGTNPQVPRLRGRTDCNGQRSPGVPVPATLGGEPARTAAKGAGTLAAQDGGCRANGRMQGLQGNADGQRAKVHAGEVPCLPDRVQART